jgi:Glycosyl transferases group 1
MRILLWHVHGSWTTAFVQGGHEYLIPVLPGHPPDGRGRPTRPGTFDWPPNAAEIAPAGLRSAGIDVVIAQRTNEPGLLTQWTGLRPGVDVPVVYVEHNAPQGRIADMRHPAAGIPGVVIVHVTHFNELFWDCGPARTVVIEHGIPDPGYRYTGELPAAAVVVNEPVRRGRVTGTDLLDVFRRSATVDVFGMGSSAVGGTDLPHKLLLDELPRRRLYLHPIRWTSLGLSLIEAMHLGMPVVALATTEAPSAVLATAGVVSTDVARLRGAVRRLIADPALAREMGQAARMHALARYGLGRFLADWDRLLVEVVGS